MHLKGKHVFITGGNQRLGRAVSELLLKEEIKLTSTYRSSATAAATLVEFGAKLGRNVFTLKMDLRELSQIADAVSKAIDHFGPIDILINCASDFYPTPVLSCSEEQWDSLLETNLKGQFFLAKACAKKMLKNGGLIINFADTNGEHPLKNFTPYVISKAGILMMTRNLALEWAPKIRVNSISPGPVLLPEAFSEEQKKRAEEKTLLKRLGSPSDISSAVLFLIGNDYINGFNLCVDGGR